MRKSEKLRSSDPKSAKPRPGGKKGRGRGPRDGSGPNTDCPMRKGRGKGKK
jgi:hypothetical protein